MNIDISLILCLIGIVVGGLVFYHSQHLKNLQLVKDILTNNLNGFKQEVKNELLQKQSFEHQRHIDDLQRVQNIIRESFTNHKQELQQNLTQINSSAEQHLKTMHVDLENKLQQSFSKSQGIFTDITNRLTLIDVAQKNLADLTTNIVSLQNILADKRSRGAFGEMQLKHLVENMLPAEHISWQHSLSTGARCDCLLRLPQPTGDIVIDAKFPLENYQKMLSVDSMNKQIFVQNFKNDVKIHLQDIARKYIISGETAECALMFIPAEAVFAEIHAQFPELVALAHNLRVWIVSPTTLMAILTTACSVLKDVATRKHIDVIKQHIQALSQDFQRFDVRWQKLLKHLELAHEDATDLNTSAKKITVKFNRIKTADVESLETEMVN